MITLYSYPELFGVADNNGYGLKVFAFLQAYRRAVRAGAYFRRLRRRRAGSLPYIVDDGETIGDSETIIAHRHRKYRLTIDAALSAAQRDTDLLITRMLDDLYWVMSYSRWKDERYFPAFRDALIASIRASTKPGLRKAQRIQRSALFLPGHRPLCARRRLRARPRRSAVLADLIPADGYVHGRKPANRSVLCVFPFVQSDCCDPDKVTIAGKSAGSQAASALMASPLAKGLFARVIGESGSMFASPSRALASLEEAEAAGLDFMRKVGAHSLAELRASPADAILAAAPRLFCPIIDGGFCRAHRPRSSPPASTVTCP